MDEHLRRVRELLTAHQLDALIVSTPANITYLTQFNFLSSSEREAFLLITNDAQYVISSFLYQDEIKKAAPSFTFLDVALNGHTPFWQHIQHISQKEQLQKIGFEKYNVTFAEYEVLKEHDINLTPIVLDGIRATKSTDEIEHIKKACLIADNAFAAILDLITPGMTEKELSFLLETDMRRQGAEPAFPSIIAFGKNAAVPHHKTDDTVLQSKDSILLDFGASYNNYSSDMSRTIFMGKPTAYETRVYETVKVAQEKAIAFLSEGKPPLSAAKADKIARDYITAQDFPDFPHSLGHSIGIEVHDGFGLSPSSPTQLLEGMVFSIEPGIYIPGEIGVRIEDLAVLTTDGLELITHTPRNLIVL